MRRRRRLDDRGVAPRADAHAFDALRTILAAAAVVLALTAIAACDAPPPDPRLVQYDAARLTVGQRLVSQDELDFEIITRQQWDQVPRSSSTDIMIHWPDGHMTVGLDKYIQGLKAMVLFAPNTRIEVHPVRIGQGDWTTVVGIMEGTFNRSIATGGGQSIAATGMSFKLPICRVAHWKGGVVDEAYLFWDNQSYLKQIGLMR